MPSIDFSELNFLSNFGIGSIGLAILIFVLALMVVGIIGAGIWWWITRKQLKYTIPLTKKVGDQTIRVAKYKAKDFKVGFAGDKLWYVPKAKKFITPATLQTAKNEYTHHEREDGEWINVSYPDVDEKMKSLGVKFVHQDMKATRIAIGEILESRFKDKQTWWGKYGHLVTHLIFYMIVVICMIIIFYQWGTIIDKTGQLFDKVVAYENMKCPATQGVVPVESFMPLLYFWRFRKWKN